MRKKNMSLYGLIENFVDSYTDEHGRTPSVREIGEGVNSSIATVSRFLNEMKRDGRIIYDGTRNIKTQKMLKQKDGVKFAPLVGEIACGSPILAEENIVEYYPLPISVFGNDDMFILKAVGDSMIDAGIEDGDFVVVRVQNVAENGQIIVALIDEVATLKKYYKEKGRIRLSPANDAYDDMIYDRVTVQGVAVNIIKKI